MRILQVWGLTEAQAAREVATMLYRTAKNQTMRQISGHDACAELMDVLRRYPDTLDPRTGDGTCA